MAWTVQGALTSTTQVLFEARLRRARPSEPRSMLKLGTRTTMPNNWWRAVLAARFLLLVGSPVAAKAPIEKITVSGPGLAVPVEITDEETMRLSNPWYGKFIEWSASVVEAPHGTTVYDVTLHARLRASELSPIYQFRYAPAASGQHGRVYLPGKGEPGHRQNVSIIIRRDLDGRWNLASPDWDIRMSAALSRRVPPAKRGAAEQ
jgi:hypothetical protein